MRTPRRRLTLVLASIATLIGLLPLGPPAQAAVTINKGFQFTTTLGGPIQFTQYKDVGPSTAPNDLDDPPGTNYTRLVNVLQIAVPGTPTVDVVMPQPSTPGTKLLSAIVPGETNSIAGINGDFGFGRPEHALAVDGTLWQTGARADANFALAQNEQKGYISRPTPNLSVLNGVGTQLFGVDRWNDGPPPSTAEVVGFSPKSTAPADSPQSGKASCAARLNGPSGGPVWGPQKKGVIFNYTVDKVKCVGKLGTQLTEGGKAMLYASGKTGVGALAIKGLTAGQAIQVKWALGFAGAVDSIGGDPQMLDNNVVTQTAIDYKCNQDVTVGCRNGRAVVGINQACTISAAGCKVFLAVVDGRQGGWSAGYGLADMATFMRDTVGAYDVLNLDGGGSVGMWLKRSVIPDSMEPDLCQAVQGDLNTNVGCFVNRPTTNGTTIVERAIESSIVLKDGLDVGEPTPSGP